jgi:hypothetical protein
VVRQQNIHELRAFWSHPAGILPGCPFSDRPKRGRKKPHRERPGTGFGSRRSIAGSGTNARATSPFSRGRRTGRGDGIAKFTWRHFLSTPLFLPSPGERRKGERRALLTTETLVSAETARPESPPWRGRDRVGRYAAVATASPCGAPSRRIPVRDAAPRKARKTRSAEEGGEPTGTR